MENNRDNINFPSFSGFLILNGTPILNGFDFFFFYILWYDKKSVSWTCAWLTDCRNFPRWDMLQILCTRQIFCRLFIILQYLVTWNQGIHTKEGRSWCDIKITWNSHSFYLVKKEIQRRKWNREYFKIMLFRIFQLWIWLFAMKKIGNYKNKKFSHSLPYLYIIPC